MSETAIQSYLDKWLAVQPQQRIALAFVEPRRYPGHVALAALEQELLGAAYGIREPQVAVAKLHWWAEELAGAAQSGGRHPLTQLLFADQRAPQVSSERWLAPVQAAMAQLEEGTAADFPAQLAAAEPLHGALARLETAWWFGTQAPPERAIRIATLTHVLYALLRLEEDAERDRLPLPMARLARYGLSRVQLRQSSVAREQAIVEQLNDLLSAWDAASRLAGPLSAFRGLEARHGRWLTAHAARHPQPLLALRQGQRRQGLSVTWQAWQAAREWRRQQG
ncbi:MAG: phytoene synthase [Dyella sp.]